MKKWIGFLQHSCWRWPPHPSSQIILNRSPKGIADKEVKKHFERGIKAFKQDEFHEAAIEFEAAEKGNPMIPETHVNLAMALAAEGETDRAEEHFEKAATLIAPETSSETSSPMG